MERLLFPKLQLAARIIAATIHNIIGHTTKGIQSANCLFLSGR